MSASRSHSAEDKSVKAGEDKSLRSQATEDKTETGAVAPSTGGAPAALDGPVDRETLRASDTASTEQGKVRVKYVHHVGDKKPGGHSTLPVDEANDLVLARVAVLDPLEPTDS